MSQSHGADSRPGCLRAVLLHRPGSELTRVTRRNRALLRHGRLPWLARAQAEHDAFAQALRGHGVEVLYLTQLLQDVLEYQEARAEAIASALAADALGGELRRHLGSYLHDLHPEDLARVLIAGLTPGEFPAGRGLVYSMLERDEFILDPLPDLVFTRDSSTWVGGGAAVASLPGSPRSREPGLAHAVYRHHPRFAGAAIVRVPGRERVAGCDLLELAPGVVAVGIGNRTSPAGAERLALRLFETGLSRVLLAVPTARHGLGGCLATMCAAVAADTLLMHPGLAYTLTAHLVTPHPGGVEVARPRPFLEAAAGAMGIAAVRLLSAGTSPFTSSPELGDDGGGVLTLSDRLIVSPERNVELNALLEAAGIEVIAVPASELGGPGGGPCCLSCPVGTETATGPSPLAACGPPPAVRELPSGRGGQPEEPCSPALLPAVAAPAVGTPAAAGASAGAGLAEAG